MEYSKQNSFVITLTILLVFLSSNNVLIKAQAISRKAQKTIRQGSIIPHKVHVTINNKLGDNIFLDIHCKSKDNDLGNQNVGDGGSFHINFRPSFWGGTNFACDLAWNNTHGHFDLYAQYRDQDRCRTCIWDVQKDGVHGTDCQGGAEQIWFRWIDQYKPPL